ncbi:hypothetical protein C8C83_2137 [Flavobacterium sp. 90]|uniref:hypothetical protein n=1 Tax=unclassified Flavobacterium TaxID=196869 RepID=UPI000EB2E8B5|nr:MULTISPECIES: hypothetical protein [unclassified Flavobacterium]RKR10461.1 hypothetical protein C8C82_2440 [Flavobacterium sp. 81]TCK54246.1 hypothetical protein C8C83_2137 [Flavobacterium sp. 90]
MITNKIAFDVIIKENNEFIDRVFDINDNILVIEAFKSSSWINFENCIFNCKELVIKNVNKPKLLLEFKNCTFNCIVTFSNCSLEGITFKNTKALNSLNLGNGKSKLILGLLNFSNDVEIEKPKLITDFSIRNTIIDLFIFEKINHINGKFLFLGNELGKSSDIISFQNSIITNVLFGNNRFFARTIFKRVGFNSTLDNLKPIGSSFEFPGFYKNSFSKISFSESKFTGSFQFENCDFLSTSWFENCKNSNNAKLKFIACEFKGFSLFNKSEIHFLDITRCTFAKSSSFTDAEFNILKLFEVKFGGGAYFDEMKINKVLDKSYLRDKSKILEWKRTLRAIKQELQKTENKIDFNTYRNYELSAHYEELSIFTNFKDTSILWATKWSSNFGNWFWSLGFTILSGLFWFTILYRIENSSTFNFEKINDFFVGAFRFFLVTDFYNPLENERTYLEHGWSWLIFILGKIFIAFGIYEMIQSFRKFKA